MVLLVYSHQKVYVVPEEHLVRILLYLLIVQLRKQAKEQKNWTTADYIRDQLSLYGIEIQDTKNGVEWKIKK